MRRSPFANDLSQAMGGQSTAVSEVIFDFLRHETDGSPQLDEGQPTLPQVKDRLDADMKKVGNLSGCP